MFDRDRPHSAESVWTFVAERYQPRLLLFAQLMLGPALRARYSAEDLVQEAHLRAFRAFDAFEWRGNGSFYRWLCLHARRAAIDWARRLEGQPREEDATISAAERRPGASPLGTAAPTPPSVVAMRDDLRAIRESLESESVPTLYREVLIALVIEGREVQEVAAERGVDPGVLRKQKQRALEIWRERLRGRGIDPEALF